VIDNSYFRFYQTAVKGIGGNWNVGLGYMLDHHYNIAEVEADGIEGYLKTYPAALIEPQLRPELFFRLRMIRVSIPSTPMEGRML
jgi:hypothetical protein